MKWNRFSALILLKFMTLLPITAPVANASTSIERSCAAKAEYLTASRSRATSVEQMISSVASENDDVVLLGVEHGNFEDEFYPSFVKMVKNRVPQANCFFIEESISSEDAILVDQFNHNVGDADEKLKSRMPWVFEWFTALKNENLKIHYVDFPGKDDMPMHSAQDSVNWLNARDKHMAELITHLKTTLQCKTAIFPVGAAHLVKSNGRIELTSLLKKRGLRTSQILLLVAGRNSANLENYEGYSLLNSGLMWFTGIVRNTQAVSEKLLCKNNFAIPKKPFAFLNGATDVPLVYSAKEKVFLGTLGEFQSTIIYPGQSSGTRIENEALIDELKGRNVQFF